VRTDDATIKNIHVLIELKEKYKQKLMEVRASGSAILLLDHLFENPYTTIPRAQEYLHLTYPSAKNAVQTLVEAGILEEAKMFYRGKVFYAKEIEESLRG